MELDDYYRHEKFAHRASAFYVRDDINLTQEEYRYYRLLIENADVSRIEQERLDSDWVMNNLYIITFPDTTNSL